MSGSSCGKETEQASAAEVAAVLPVKGEKRLPRVRL